MKLFLKKLSISLSQLDFLIAHPGAVFLCLSKYFKRLREEHRQKEQNHWPISKHAFLAIKHTTIVPEAGC